MGIRCKRLRLRHYPGTYGVFATASLSRSKVVTSLPLHYLIEHTGIGELLRQAATEFPLRHVHERSGVEHRIVAASISLSADCQCTSCIQHPIRETAWTVHNIPRDRPYVRYERSTGAQ